MGVTNMLEGKDFQSVDVVFRFVTALIGRAMSFLWDASQAFVYIKYLELVIKQI